MPTSSAVSRQAGAPDVSVSLTQTSPMTARHTEAADVASHRIDFERVRSRLRAELGDAVFTSWFGRLELDMVASGTAYLSVPTRFLKSWIEAHYLDRLLQTMIAADSSITQIAIRLRGSAGRQTQQPAPLQETTARAAVSKAPSSAVANHAVTPASASGERDQDGFSGSPLDRRLTFDSFVIGQSNRLAHAAAQGIAQGAAGALPVYNPLYIHAAVGLGKTHLLQAVAHGAAGQGRRVTYLTAEKFMYGFVAALKAQTAIAFKEKLRAIDVLIIDDVQFLTGKSIQQEFCHTLNALVDARRQIIIAADRPPSELESLEERVRSRLAGGLCVEIAALDEELRLKILSARIETARTLHPAFNVPPAVLAYVAQSIQTNGRDLDGAVNRLLAHATLTGIPLTIETAETAIRDLIRTREPKRVKIEDIQKLVAVHFNVSRADLLSSRRTANVVRPRQIAMYLAKMLTPRSLPEIGRRFGGRDHTTVLHAVRKIEQIATQDLAMGQEIELLKRMLQE